MGYTEKFNLTDDWSFTWRVEFGHLLFLSFFIASYCLRFFCTVGKLWVEWLRNFGTVLFSHTLSFFCTHAKQIFPYFSNIIYTKIMYYLQSTVNAQPSWEVTNFKGKKLKSPSLQIIFLHLWPDSVPTLPRYLGKLKIKTYLNLHIC